MRQSPCSTGPLVDHRDLQCFAGARRTLSPPVAKKQLRLRWAVLPCSELKSQRPNRTRSPKRYSLPLGHAQIRPAIGGTPVASGPRRSGPGKKPIKLSQFNSVEEMPRARSPAASGGAAEGERARRLFTLVRTPISARPISASTSGAHTWLCVSETEKQLCVLLQRLEFRLEPNLCDEGGHHSTADHGRQQDGVLSLIDDVIGQTKQCRDRTEG
jgi:hypothetical protein